MPVPNPAEVVLETLAQALLEQDSCAAFEALAEFLTARQHRDLATMMELCPLHGCDYRICADDRASCQD